MLTITINGRPFQAIRHDFGGDLQIDHTQGVIWCSVYAWPTLEKLAGITPQTEDELFRRMFEARGAE